MISKTSAWTTTFNASSLSSLLILIPVRVQRQAVGMESSAFVTEIASLLTFFTSFFCDDIDHQQEPAENQEGEVNRTQWRLWSLHATNKQRECAENINTMRQHKKVKQIRLKDCHIHWWQHHQYFLVNREVHYVQNTADNMTSCKLGQSSWNIGAQE